MDADRTADLVRRCADAGREILGFGDAGIVLAAGSSWVIKFGYDGADGWPAWARWCMARPGPHKPVIAALEVVDHEGQPVAFVAVMERLQPTLTAARWMRAAPGLKRDPAGLAAFVQEQNPGIAATLRDSARAFPFAHWDMGGPNWMERADGTLVLTDPISRVVSEKHGRALPVTGTRAA